MSLAPPGTVTKAPRGRRFGIPHYRSKRSICPRSVLIPFLALKPLLNMSQQPSFSTLIHIRDFVDTITDDPTRENGSNYVEIQTDINIFEEGGFYSP